MTAHSLPKEAVVRGDPYEDEVRSAAKAIAAMVCERVGEDLLVARGDVREAKFVPDVVGAQRRVVDNGPEGEAALEVRQKHGPREVPGSDHINTRHGARKLAHRRRRFLSRLSRDCGRRACEEPVRQIVLNSGTEGAIVVQTGRPDAFYSRLTELAASGELGTIHEVTSPDDNLQAVFQYLVKS